MRIVAVVLNFRRPEDTIACVRSLQQDAPDVEPLVVDNASGDGSYDRMRGALPGVEVIASGGNLGYTGGNNVGIGKALERGAEAVLILNNDLVVETGCVEQLTKTLHERAWGIVSPLSLLDRPGQSDIVDFFTGRVMLDHAALVAPGRDEPRGNRYTEPRESEYLTGSALLVKREVFDRVGLLDDRFFLVWEDVDLSLRARAAGFAIGATPHAVVRHARSVTFGDQASPLQRYFFVRNPYLLVRKHLPLPRRLLAEARITRRYTKWARDKSADPRVSRAISAGMRHGIRGRFGPPPAWLMP